MAKSTVVSPEVEEKVVHGLRGRPYWQLILGTVILSAMTAADMATPDCLPFVDEASLATLSSAFMVALIRKALADLSAR
mgnify:CR=1 FL=1